MVEDNSARYIAAHSFIKFNAINIKQTNSAKHIIRGIQLFISKVV